MKRIYMMYLGLAWMGLQSATAQCSFTPTISPSSVMFYCDGETDTLYTQTYDAYQWYKNGVAIPGATQNSLVIDQYNYAGTYISVEATLSGCTEHSDSILADQWMYLPPFIITHTPPLYIQGFGESYYCFGDTVLLEASGPFGSLIWTRNGNVIPGATNSLLNVTLSGDYTAYGPLGFCPDDTIYVGVEVPIRFRPAFVPVIQTNASGLYTTDGESWQWYLNGNALSGATDSVLISPAPGTYVLHATDTLGCEGQSTPYIVEPNSVENPGEPQVRLYPNPVSQTLFIQSSTAAEEILLTDLAGRVILSRKNAQEVDLSTLTNGVYMVSLRFEKLQLTRRIVVQH